MSGEVPRAVAMSDTPLECEPVVRAMLKRRALVRLPARWLLLVLVLGGAAPADADSQFGVGVVAGLHRANLNGNPVPETSLEARMGFVLGASVSMQVRDDLWLSLEPSYVRRGGNVVTVVDDLDDVEETTRLDLDYLDLPLVARVRGSGEARPYAVGGIGIGFLLDATARPPGSGSVNVADLLIDAEGFAVFGGGVEASIGEREFLFELRYTQGLANVNRGGATPVPIPLNFKNTGLQFLVGWKVKP